MIIFINFISIFIIYQKKNNNPKLTQLKTLSKKVNLNKK